MTALHGAARSKRRRSEVVAVTVLVVLALGVIVVPTLASQDPLHIDAMLTRSKELNWWVRGGGKYGSVLERHV